MASDFPDTLIECVLRYSDEQSAYDMVKAMRWGEGVICPFCEGERHYAIPKRQRWECAACHKQFSLKTRTIFEGSFMPFGKWLVLFWMIANSKNGVSSHEAARTLGVQQRTAWFMLHRIRYALKAGTIEKMDGTVEVDETYLGQKAKTMHLAKKKEKITGSGTADKTPVLGVLERGNGTKDENGKVRRPKDRIYSQVSTQKIERTDSGAVEAFIEGKVQKGAEVFTDAHKAYRGLPNKGYIHGFIDHAKTYKDGRICTNGIENVWGLLDRMMHGTYVFCLPHHLNKYLAELDFRFNHRAGTDLSRFLQALTMIAGKRLKYTDLTGTFDTLDAVTV